MKVFLSWSGARSKAVALAFREWLPMVLQYAKPWMSDHDIQAGARWAADVAGELDDCNFGVIFLTRSNMDKPWVLFEAGALAKSVKDSRVIPLLIDGLEPAEVAGPLSQFQAKPFSQAGVLDVLETMNAAKTETPVSAQHLNSLFAGMWRNLEEATTASAQIEIAENIPRKRDPTEIIDEVLLIVRRLDAASRANAARRYRPAPSSIHTYYTFCLNASGISQDYIEDTVNMVGLMPGIESTRCAIRDEFVDIRLEYTSKEMLDPAIKVISERFKDRITMSYISG